MATITPSEALIGQVGDFNGVNYSGTFIPTLWSAKLLDKFYASTVFGEIANTQYEGEIKNLGDKVIINSIPDVSVSAYTIGNTLTYDVPAPSTQEFVIDKAFRYAFQLNDVLVNQSKVPMLDTFTGDASMKMKIAIDSTVIYNTFASAHASNKGATAGAKSGGYNLGTDDAPLALTANNVLQLITSFAAVLDEQNIPETDRWLVIDPATRQLLMQSNLAQAQFMGDSTSILRNGRIGGIDRFTVYVSNQLPKAAAGTNTAYVSGDGSENSITSTGDAKRRILMAGHKQAITFASQLSKMETLRNPTDFGDYVRALQVFGYKVLQPTALTYAVVA